jgi:hypothetical protein
MDLNFEKSEIRGQRSEQNSQLSILNPVKGRGPNGALRPQPSIELHIEELVLHGFAAGERYAIGDAVEHELARLLHEQSIPISLQSENAADEIKGATFNAAHNAKPRAIGRQIAQAVYQGFCR